jgi:hypothetical protein
MGERKEANRRASGAALNPCKPIRAKAGNEYPHASTALGCQGSGLALIQRTGTKENTEEGSTFNLAKRGNCSYLERPVLKVLPYMSWFPYNGMRKVVCIAGRQYARQAGGDLVYITQLPHQT